MSITAVEARQRLRGCAIWLWQYLHADWQWEQSRAWHEDRYAAAVNEALDIMQHDPEFMYFCDNVGEFYEAVAQRLGPRLEEFKQRVREGRIRIASAQVANCRPTQVGDETYLRNLQLGRAFFEENLPPTDLSLFHSVDVAIGGSQMPQILTQAGFSYYRAMRPHGPMNALGIPHQFIWEGLDGSRILVTRGPYGGLGTGELDGYVKDWDGTVVRLFDHYFHDQLIHDRSPSKQLFLIQGGDDVRPLRGGAGDRPVPLLGFLAEWRRRERVPIRWCTPLEFSQAVTEKAEQLPVVQGVLDGVDCGYNVANQGSYGLWLWRQMNDRRLLRAEWWAAAAAASTGFATPHEKLRRLWRQHLTYQAHAQEFAFQEDFDYLISLARDVQFHAEQIEHDALRSIVQAAGGGDRATRYIFNPHPWSVQVDAEIYHACALAGVESLEIVDEEGQPLPQQRLAEFRHPRFAGSVNDQRRLVRLTLPPLGFRRVIVVEKADPAPELAPEPEEGTLEVGGLRLVYRDHALREVHDRQAGTMYFSRDGSPYPNLAFHVLDRQDWVFGGPELRREPFVPERSRWLHSGPLRWQHQTWGTVGPYQAQIDTVVGERERELQVRVRLEGHWHEPPVTGFVTLMGDVEAGGQVTVDVPFGVEPRDPGHDVYVHNVPQDRDLGVDSMFERLRPGFFWGRSWADWSGCKRGVTWISTDGCYYWFKEPGSLGHILLRAVQRKPDTWETFCAEGFAGSGVHSFSYALCFHDGQWRAADPQRRSAELRHPPIAMRADHSAPATLQTSSFLRLEGPVLLSAYYHDGDKTFIRIYESEGTGGEATITLPWSPSTVQVVDLLGRILDIPANVADRTISLRLRPWQIATVSLT